MALLDFLNKKNCMNLLKNGAKEELSEKMLRDFKICQNFTQA